MKESRTARHDLFGKADARVPDGLRLQSGRSYFRKKTVPTWGGSVFLPPDFFIGAFSESCTYHDVKRRPPLQAAACGLTVIKYVSAVTPIVTAEQVTGVSLIIKVTFCKFGQVHLFHLFKGKIFVIAVLAYISVIKFAY